MKYLKILLLVIMLVASSFALIKDLTPEKDPATLDVVAIIDSKPVYKITDTNPKIYGEQLTKQKYSLLTDTSQASKFMEFEVKNLIDNNNVIKDCDLFVCDFIVEFTPEYDMRIDPNHLLGGVDYGSAKPQKVFYYEDLTFFRDVNVYDNVTRKVCNINNITLEQECQNKTYTEKIGTTLVQQTKTVERENFNLKIFKQKTKNKVVFRFTRNNLVESDIYPVIFGTPFPEWAIWGNGSWTSSQVINTTWLYGYTGITSTIPIFASRVEIDGTNASRFNHTNDCLNVRFSDENDTVGYDYDYVQGCNTTTLIYYVFTQNQTNGSGLKIWADNLEATSGNNGSIEGYRAINYYGVYHMTDAGNTTLVDSANYNNLTEGATCAGDAQAGRSIGTYLNASASCFYGTNTAVGFPLGANPSTESFVYLLNATGWNILLSYGNYRQSIADGAGGQANKFVEVISVGIYAGPQPKIQNIWTCGATRYNGSSGFTYLNQTLASTPTSANLIDNGLIRIARGNDFLDTLYFTGGLDEVRFRNETSTNDFNDAECALIYNFTGVWVEDTTLITNQLPTITPATAFFNTTLFFNSSVANISSENVTQINWTIFVNGSSYLVGQTNGSFADNITVNLHNETNFTAASTLILQVESLLTNSTWLVATNSSELTIQNTVPVITNLNFSANGSSYLLGPVQANVTVADIDPESITLFWNWFKNNANQTGLAGSKTVSPDVQTTVELPPVFTLNDDWGIMVWATDLTSTSVFLNSSNTTIFNYTSNLTRNTTSPQFDTQVYSHVLNTTMVGGLTMNATIEAFGSNTTATAVDLTSHWAFNVSLIPPTVSNSTDYNIIWHYSTILSNGSFYMENTSYNVTVNPSGIFICNATITTPTITYTFIDEETGQSINATMSAVYTYSIPSGATKVNTFSTTNNTIYTCIEPHNLTVTAVAEEFLNKTGYSSRAYTQVSQVYSNASINRQLSLLNASSTLSETILVTVKTNVGLPFIGYTVQVQKYNLTTNTYFNTTSVVTDINGQSSFQALIQTPKYNVSVFDPSGTQIYTQGDIVFCQDGTTPCTFTIIIGGLTPDYYNGSGSTYDDSYGVVGFGTNFISTGRFCNFNNATFMLNCSWDYTQDAIQGNSMNLILTNGSVNDKSILVSNTSNKVGDTGEVSILVPSADGNYYYRFVINYVDNSTSSSFNYTKIIQNGVITVNRAAQNVYGPDGWMITGILVLIISLSLAPVGAPAIVLGAGGALLVSAVIGLISLNPLTFAAILILTVIVVLWVKD